MRRLNPSFLMLHYQLAVGAGPAPFVDGEQWTNDFAKVTQHEPWFMHDEMGHRLLQRLLNAFVEPRAIADDDGGDNDRGARAPPADGVANRPTTERANFSQAFVDPGSARQHFHQRAALGAADKGGPA